MSAPAARPRRVRLARPRGGTAVFAVAPLVDVLLILLVFFLVSSTYLELDMIPMVETTEAPAAAGPGRGAGADGPGAMLVRLGPDGTARLGGATLDRAALAVEIASRLAARPDASVLVLPSPQAPAQALVDVLGAAAEAGARAVRVVRVSEAPR